MQLSYFYKKTAIIEKYLQETEINKKIIDLLPKPPHVEENLRRKSLLKSSLFSARIEGNKLRLEDVQDIFPSKKIKDIAQIEIFNILKALGYLYSSQAPKKLTLSFLIDLHKLVLSGISPEAGNLRKESSAIFNQAGVAIYITPPPGQVPNLLKNLIGRINSSKEPGPVTAAMSHFSFEKIHPFLDGNGRIGRLLSTFILKNTGYGFRGLVSLEEYIEAKRQTYYDLLTLRKKDITEFIEFFLEGLSIQSQKAIDGLKNIPAETPEDTLLPRRREILEIIRDHKMVSFNFIRRRFVRIPDSTLHYDLKQLLKINLIKKLGSTKGVVYSSK